MIEIFLRLSGLISMLFAWLFIVIPAIKFGIKDTRQTISSATKNQKVRTFVSIGLIVGSLFQITFLIYLALKFQLSFYNIGCLLYLSATIATVLVALFTEQKSFLIHSFFVKYYFLIYPISLLMITGTLYKAYLYLFVFTCFTVFVYFFGVWWTIKKFGISARVEQWAFLVLSVWTIVFTVV